MVWAYGIASDYKFIGTLAGDARKQVVAKLPEATFGNSETALFAAADAAACAALEETESSIASIHALQTVLSGSFGSKIRRDALASDYKALSSGTEITDLLIKPLWSVARSEAFLGNWRLLESRLLGLQHSWEVWTTWYLDRFYGRPIDARRVLRWVEILRDYWPTEAGILNAKFNNIIDSSKPNIEIEKASEPELEPGPEFDITAQGLTLKSPHPLQAPFDERTQRHLHERLKKQAPDLAQTSRGSNAAAHRGLADVATEYAELIDRPFEALDVVSLWAVGAGLLANRDAFARAHDARTMAEPLEPGHFALLQQVAEIHGGFILGFREARELSERADQARVSGEAMEKVVSLARGIIGELRNSPSEVDARTRRFLAAVEEGLVEPGWKITRAGYAAYVVTRNALIAIGRLLSWANSALATVVGGIALSHVDPGLVHTQFWIEFVLKNSQQILAFAEPFPELKIWLNAQIEAAKVDDEMRE